MADFKISPPWYTFRKKVEALFGADPDIVVGDIYPGEDGHFDFLFDIEVRSHKKFLALDRVLPKAKEFGNVRLGIAVFDEENGEDDPIETFRALFEGNPDVKDVIALTDPAGVPHGYVRFVPEVVQFFNDDMSDASGNWSGLAQDIAREIFEDSARGVHFCTADIREYQICTADIREYQNRAEDDA